MLTVIYMLMSIFRTPVKQDMIVSMMRPNNMTPMSLSSSHYHYHKGRIMRDYWMRSHKDSQPGKGKENKLPATKQPTSQEDTTMKKPITLWSYATLDNNQGDEYPRNAHAMVQEEIAYGLCMEVQKDLTNMERMLFEGNDFVVHGSTMFKKQDQCAIEDKEFGGVYGTYLKARFITKLELREMIEEWKETADELTIEDCMYEAESLEEEQSYIDEWNEHNPDMPILDENGEPIEPSFAMDDYSAVYSWERDAEYDESYHWFKVNAPSHIKKHLNASDWDQVYMPVVIKGRSGNNVLNPLEKWLNIHKANNLKKKTLAGMIECLSKVNSWDKYNALKKKYNGMRFADISWWKKFHSIKEETKDLPAGVEVDLFKDTNAATKHTLHMFPNQWKELMVALNLAYIRSWVNHKTLSAMQSMLKLMGARINDDAKMHLRKCYKATVSGDYMGFKENLIASMEADPNHTNWQWFDSLIGSR